MPLGNRKHACANAVSLVSGIDEWWLPSRVPYNVPQECLGSVKQESLARVPHKCPTKVPHKGAPQECPTRVSHKRVTQECPTSNLAVSHNMSHKCPTVPSYKSVPPRGGVHERAIIITIMIMVVINIIVNLSSPTDPTVLSGHAVI